MEFCIFFLNSFGLSIAFFYYGVIFCKIDVTKHLAKVLFLPVALAEVHLANTGKRLCHYFLGGSNLLVLAKGEGVELWNSCSIVNNSL